MTTGDARPRQREHEPMPNFEHPTKKMLATVSAVRGWPAHNERLAAVEIGVMAVYLATDEDGEPRPGEALREDNDVCYAKIKIRSKEDRAADKQRGLLVEDARIVINGDRWGGISAAMQRSEIDRCLTSIKVKVKDEKPVLDDVGRPKLTKVPPDKVIRIYHDVVERSGASSRAGNDLRVLFHHDQHRQLYLPLLDPAADLPAITVARPRTSSKKLPAVAGYEIGDMGAEPLSNMIDRIDRPETLLALARLAMAKKYKGPIKTAITKRAKVLKVKTELQIVKDGHDPTFDFDFAAAVLLSTAAPDDGMLERLVPECEDVMVLELLHSDELDDDGGRPQIVDLLANRIDNLMAAQASAETEDRDGPTLVH